MLRGRPWSAARRSPCRPADRAFTLPEVLTAAFVLGLLTTAALWVLTPMLRKTGWVERHQDRQQSLVLCREQLGRILTRVRLLEVEETFLTFQLPREVESPVGDLGIIDPTESLEWEEGELRELVLEGGLLQVRRRLTRDQARPLWRMGEGATMRVSQAAGEPRLVTFAFSLPPVEDSLEWEGSFTLFLPTAP